MKEDESVHQNRFYLRQILSSSCRGNYTGDTCAEKSLYLSKSALNPCLGPSPQGGGLKI